MAPLLHAESASRKRTVPVSTVGLLLIGSVSLFVVFQVTWHQWLRQSVVSQGQLQPAQHQGSSGSSGSSSATGDSAAAEAAQKGLSGAQARTQVQASHAQDAASATTSSVGDSKCHMELHNEYHGAVVAWGEKNQKDTVEACCQHCEQTPDCNVWVYCPNPTGCGDINHPRPHKECWLKRAKIDELLENVIGRGHPGIAWTSGAIYTSEQYQAHQRRLQEKRRREEERRKALRDNQELPLVYLDVSVDGKPAGRIELVLFMKDSPRAAENMRVMCSGEKGSDMHLKGVYFYRIIDRFIDQTGINHDSIYGGTFADDEGGLKLQHDRPYLLSMANGGPNTNTAHFSITVAPAHHLDGHYTIFGEAVSGFDVIEKVNALSRGQKNNELLNSKRAQIVDAGQLRRGTLRPPPVGP